MRRKKEEFWVNASAVEEKETSKIKYYGINYNMCNCPLVVGLVEIMTNKKFLPNNQNKNMNFHVYLHADTVGVGGGWADTLFLLLKFSFSLN